MYVSASTSTDLRDCRSFYCILEKSAQSERKSAAGTIARYAESFERKDGGGRLPSERAASAGSRRSTTVPA